MNVWDNDWLYIADDLEVSLNLLPNGKILIADPYYGQYEEFDIEFIIDKFKSGEPIYYGDFDPKLYLNWGYKSDIKCIIRRLEQCVKFMNSVRGVRE